MGYKFKINEPISDGARRIAHEQILKAHEELTSQELAPDEAVHQARKRFKKLRGLIRLLRKELGDAYAEENAWYRDTARLLSGARDAAVLVETFDDTREAFADQLHANAFEGARLTLVARREATAGNAHELQTRIEQVVAHLKEAADRVNEWPVVDCDLTTLRKGMEKVYSQGRDRFKEACDQPSAEAFHDWRKAVKYHWYHTRLLEPCWKAVMKARKKELSDLADVLGDLHDLAVLRETLLAEPGQFGSSRDLQALIGLIDQRMTELAAEARPTGQRLFAEKPDAIGKRIEAYWKAAKSEKQRAGAYLEQPGLAESKD